MTTSTGQHEVLAKAASAEWEYRFELLPVAEMYVDKRYQRDYKENALAGPFNPALVGTVIVSDRPKGSKRWSLIDGQHRWEKVKDEGLTHIPALIYTDWSMEEEAQLFSELQLARKAITPFERFRADLAAQNPTAHAVNKIMRDEGYEMSDQGSAANMRMVAAVRGIERIYAQEPELLRRTLRLIRETWDGVPNITRDNMLKGVAAFIDATEDLDELRFVNRLKDLTPSEIERRASYLRESRGMTGASSKLLAEVLQTAYRKARR